MAERLRRLVDELNRRKVISTAGMYLVFSFVTMQVVDAVFQYLPFENPDAAGQLVLVLLTIGFPIVLVVSWFLELVPPRFQKELPGPGADLSRGEAPAPEVRPDAVAVLPFENLSGDPDNVYFSDGVTEDIVSSISHVQGLRVLSRHSVAAVASSEPDLRAVASRLGVATLVSGSVRRSGDRVRIVAAIADGAAGDQLWSETFDRELKDIFSIQSEVASQVAEALRRELSPEDRRRIEARGTTEATAYDLYLKARHLWNQRTEVAILEAIGHLERALERDPRFALAHAALAEARAVLGLYGVAEPLETLPAARKSVDAALELDPSLGEAIAVGACLAGIYDWDWERAESTYRLALREAPSYPTGHQWFAMNLLTPLGRFDEAREQLDQALLLDRESLAIRVSPGIVSFYAREYERAGAELRTIAVEEPGFSLTHLFLAKVHEQLGDFDAAIEALERASTSSAESSEVLAALAHALGAGGREEEAEDLHRRLVDRRSRRYVSSVLLAQSLLGLSRVEEALAHLEEAVEARATDLIWLGVRPSFDGLRDDPRFSTILTKIGLQQVLPPSGRGP